MTTQTSKAAYLKRWDSLVGARNTYLTHWRDLAEQVRPRSSRFLTSDATNAGAKRHGKIINGTPTWAARTLAAGMMAGITSPSRPWFRLTAPDPSLTEADPVKAWLHIVEERVREAIAKSNIYKCLHAVYSDLSTPGTAALHIDEDDETVLRGYVFPIGSYCLDANEKLDVDTMYRETTLSVRQMVRKFGLKACGMSVQDAYREGRLDERIEVLHVIQPNENFKEGKIGAQGLKWSSCWLEKGGTEDKMLRESGFVECPFVAPRWETTGEDVYGSSPAMDALGDCRALQLAEKRKATLIDKQTDPPMTGPTSLVGKGSLLPGSFTAVDVVAPGQAYRPAQEVNPAAIQVIGMELREIEKRIKTAFYADLWLMLAQADGAMTAREVVERREEKLLQLGTVLENLHCELLNPLIDRVFAILQRRGMLPPAPEELQGQQLKVEYISIMAQAQKLLGTTSIERLTTFVSNVAAVKPDVLDKLDTDQIVDEYGGMLGVPPVIIRPDDAVAEMRAQRAQAQQQAQQMAQAQQVAETTKTLASADTEGDNALTEMLRGLGAR